ncbi:MAG TPA: carbohydrate kinase [Chitinophaga sp.]
MNKSYPVVCFGETLWDVLPAGRQAGGAPMNVAYHLQRLGKNPAVISRVGFDEPGKLLIETLERKGVCTEFFQVDYRKPTSVVTATLKNEQEMSYTIAEDVAWDHIELNADITGLVAQTRYLVFGTLCARSRNTRNTLFALLDAAPQKVLDVNLRPPFYDRHLLEALLNRADIVKLSLEELELVTGWFSALRHETDRMQVLKDRFGTHTIILTCGANGAIISSGDRFVKCRGIPVTVADTVGSGDAFLAAVLAKQLDGAPLEETIDFANRLAAFIVTQKGACPDYRLTGAHHFQPSL